MAGLIQTVFLASFMFGSPICGYLGDRFNRKMIIIVGVVLWLAAVVASTFVPANLFWMFLLFRGLVGIGEASYSNVCPSMISDMFTGTIRSRMYMLFYFAVPVGSGLGFVVGTNVASWLHAWQWGVRVTAVVGVLTLAVLVFLVFEPVRGAAEASKGGQQENSEPKGSYWEDIKVLLFFACTCLSFNWGLNVDMLMSVIIPSRRSTAFSYFMLISHLFGDATGPYIIGAISDKIRGEETSPEARYTSLVKSCYVTVVLLFISAILYFVSAGTLLRDQAKFRKQMGMKESTSSISSNDKLNGSLDGYDYEESERKV
ncbi:hypothetical protein OESDEN_11326 [Oesophagostomum dentatum]|uniref:Major facilitator superfamily (MFS) profile domain-containing protein n=1 Tax=Oesophagostomum dentatum TaxID=61180 RepID=A0A0B1SV78_OESDE|nr:hypothetical protein OESDEN_11326 [Oesophagostomum dentatum]